MVDHPRTRKSIPIALALRARGVRAKLRARDVSAVARGGLVEKPRASIRSGLDPEWVRGASRLWLAG